MAICICGHEIYYIEASGGYVGWQHKAPGFWNTSVKCPECKCDKAEPLKQQEDKNS